MSLVAGDDIEGFIFPITLLPRAKGSSGVVLLNQLFMFLFTGFNQGFVIATNKTIKFLSMRNLRDKNSNKVESSDLISALRHLDSVLTSFSLQSVENKTLLKRKSTQLS